MSEVETRVDDTKVISTANDYNDLIDSDSEQEINKNTNNNMWNLGEM